VTTRGIGSALLTATLWAVSVVLILYLAYVGTPREIPFERFERTERQDQSGS
jgi:hypothetical protein